MPINKNLPINKNISSADQHWQILYSFNEKYQLQCTHCLLINGMEKLERTNPLVQFYKEYYTTGTDRQPIERDLSARSYFFLRLGNRDGESKIST